MIIDSCFKCLLTFKHPDYAEDVILCEFIDIGKCIRAFRANCDLDDDGWKKMKINISFLPCYR